MTTLEALNKLNSTVIKAYAVDPNIKFEVFIHKVDGLPDDTKMVTQRDIHQRATDELLFKSGQKLIPQLPTLENLLNVFISNSTIEKAFLFDVISKIYLATDSSPVDMQTYELCCDMIDVVIDVSCIYGATGSSEESIVI
ncbi:RRAGC_D [Lepeophtheirus salmonis]|uniref:RRAGC_D n=1 Tax=Lepeophtheirus salmonis TaxID=72036 RepID=A0A7R8CGJ7_LEPSM|nr:RRAGC_D [Lepeophtheirus salmonis]CAF2759309.1 RRAGC_D [Lepeophtheirus salmonis]